LTFAPTIKLETRQSLPKAAYETLSVTPQNFIYSLASAKVSEQKVYVSAK